MAAVVHPNSAQFHGEGRQGAGAGGDTQRALPQSPALSFAQIQTATPTHPRHGLSRTRPSLPLAQARCSAATLERAAVLPQSSTQLASCSPAADPKLFWEALGFQSPEEDAGRLGSGSGEEAGSREAASPKTFWQDLTRMSLSCPAGP